MEKSAIALVVQLSSALLGCLLLIVALTSIYWYDIINADLSDQGFGSDLKLHGGLFKTCGPPLDNSTGKTEDCFKFEEVLGSPISRPLLIGRALLITSIILVFYGCLNSVGNSKLKISSEIYLLALGLILIAFSLAASFIVSVGILVCNCLDELGRDGWLALISIFCIIIALSMSRKSSIRSDSSNFGKIFYLIISFSSLLGVLSLFFLDWFDSTLYKKYTSSSISDRSSVILKMQSIWSRNLPIDNPILQRRLPDLTNPYNECEKRFGLWQYCLGYCTDRPGWAEFIWICDSWSEYLTMTGTLNTKNWRTPIPFAINASRLWIALLFITLCVQHYFIVKKSSFIRQGFISNIILSVGALMTMYTWCILESSFQTNTSNVAAGMYICVGVVFFQMLLFITDTVHGLSDEEEDEEVESNVKAQVFTFQPVQYEEMNTSL